MAELFKLPEDKDAATALLASLGDDEIEKNLSDVVKAFSAESKTTVRTPQTLPTLQALKASIVALKGEQAERVAEAEAAVAEIDALTAEVFGDTEVAASADGSDEGAAEVVDAEPVHVITDAAPAAEPAAVTASVMATRRSSLNLSAVRQKQSEGGKSLSRYLPSETQDKVEITAAVDVPGFRPGQSFDFDDMTQGAIRRAQVLQTAGGGVGMVASYTLPFPEDLKVNDATSSPEGSLAVMHASDQRRLETGQLTASGGWCAPSETVYDIADRACPDMLWDLPEIQLNRGGIRFFRTPNLDVAAMTFVWTEANDVAAAPPATTPTKPCYVVPCATPIDVRAEAQGICLQFGILTSRYFPELIDWNIRNAMVAHEIRMKTRAYDLARAAATAVTTTVSFAAFSAVYSAVALQAADMTERFNLCEGTALEVVFPWWARNMFLADIARQQGVKPQDLNPGIIEGAFAQLGVRVQWARGIAPDFPTNIGGATAAVAWPVDIEFLIHEAGAFQLGRGPEVNLGIIVDSATIATNDQKLFSEEGVALIDRTGTARRVTVTVCPNGTVGAVPTAQFACPIA
jgi:hypothetical protein